MLIRFDRAKRNGQLGTPFTHIDLRETRRCYPKPNADLPFFFVFFYSGPAGRWPSVRPTSFSIPPLSSCLCTVPSFNTGRLSRYSVRSIFFGTHKWFYYFGLQARNWCYWVHVKTDDWSLRPGFNFLVTPLTSDPKKKGAPSLPRTRSLISVSCFPLSLYYRAAVAEWTRGIEDFALAFWLAPFQFRVVFFFLYNTHTVCQVDFFFFGGCLLPGSSISLSLSYFFQAWIFIWTERAIATLIRLRFRRLWKWSSFTASELIGSFIPKVEWQSNDRS